MVGGGRGAFIGGVHRIAAAIDGEIELVCGAFSSTPEKSIASGQDLMLPEDRCYGDFKEMIQREKRRKDRMDVVSIVTPNHMHFAPAKMALENGFHVICDKPVTFSLSEAKKLKEIIANTGLTFALTHNYTGYAMVKEARQLIKNGVLGTIRKVIVEYPQGWLSTLLEGTGNAQASWRTDPKQSGLGGAIGDIGTHAANLAEYITGAKITEICAMLNVVVPGRHLDDDSSMLLRFDNGASGVLMATQVAAGDENNLNIRVYGEKGGLEWKQQDPNTMIVKWLDKPMEIIRAGQKYLSEDAKAFTRTPAGHPEGYLEAFANIYRSFTKAVRAYKPGKKIDYAKEFDFPDVKDGVHGMAFVQTAVESSNSTTKWTKFQY